MSPRQFLRRYIGDRETLSQSRATSWLGKRLHDAEVWHLGRRSVAGGVGLGFFLAFVPLPIQMVIAAPLSLLLRVNLPVTMAALWITNPVTMAPMFLFAFKVGTWITAREAQIAAIDFEMSFEGMAAAFGEIWYPLIVGCLFCGVSAAAVGNLSVRWLWRAHLLYKRRQRRRRLASRE